MLSSSEASESSESSLSPCLFESLLSDLAPLLPDSPSLCDSFDEPALSSEDESEADDLPELEDHWTFAANEERAVKVLTVDGEKWEA